jgi:hypothetical protein
VSLCVPGKEKAKKVNFIEKLNNALRLMARSINARAAIDTRVQKINTDASRLAEEAKRRARKARFD